MSDLPFRVNGRIFISFCLVIVNGFTTANAIVNCSLMAVDESTPKQIDKKLKDNNTYLIRYKLQFPEQRNNPLANNLPHVFKADSFNRIRRKHGQTLLSLAFNYGVISLMTLTFGTSDLKVSVYESPINCLSGLNEDDSLNVVLYLLARNFDRNQSVSLHNEERICLQYIEATKGDADFKPRCYSGDTVASLADSGDIGNKWIEGLYVLLIVVKVVLICFGPLLFVEYVATLSQESAPYVVKLKEPLLRTLFVAKSLSDFDRVRGRRILNLSKCRGYPKLKQTLENSPLGRPFLAKISEYDILAANGRLILENEVPITFWGALAEAIFRCKMKNVGPMQSCCYVDMFRNISYIKRRIPWLNFCTKVGNALLILFLPFLYYLRLVLFYFFENQELTERRAAAERLGLRDSFDYSLIHYVSPSHWIFICIYVVYFVSAFTMAYLTRSDDEGRFRNTVVGSFADLGRLSYLRVLQLMIENFLWPFKRYGIFGCLVAIVYWPVVLPLTFIIYIFYSIPTIYLTFRMFFYSRRTFLEQIRTRSGVRKYQTSEKEDNDLDLFQADYLFGVKDVNHQLGKLSRISEEDELEKFRVMDSPKEKPGDRLSISPSIVRSMHIRPGQLFQHLLASFMCILSLYSLLIIVAECLGSLVEIGVFTMMGVVVNAGLTVKYAALVTLVIAYTYDSFNNIQVRYYKLNRALFIELKNRVKGLDSVTSLPSYLQENQAFKAQEQSEQGTHENPDSIAEQPSRHWFINDLVLFVDNEDAFRIPRRLFKQVCEIRSPGVPGPIYEGVLEAVYHFIKMLGFVIFIFFVVLSFGDVYELSDSTQMMAILSTGFLPIIVKTFMEPRKPDIDILSLSFKSKLDEVVKHFWQLWPIHDFSFTPMPDPEAVANTADDKGTTNTQPKADEMKNEVGEKTLVTENKVPESKAEEQVVAEIQVAENETDVKQRETVQDPATVDLVSASRPSSADTDHSMTNFQKVVRNTLGTLTSSGGNEQPSLRSSASVKLDMPENNNSTVREVDLLIRLPSRYEDEWVDGWSNIIQIKEVKKKRASDVADSMVEAAAEKARQKD